MIIGIIPAWNESAEIAGTIAALQAQTTPVDLIMVISDNSTDDTVAVAQAAGAVAIESVGNTEKKSGALNQALSRILPFLGNSDMVFVQDADTRVVPKFIETAAALMATDSKIVVSGRYACKAEHGLIGLFQRNEFLRDGRKINRRGDRTHIIVGTSALFPVRVLRHVIKARQEGDLPGGHDVYISGAQTEDFELSIAIKTLGYRTMSPRECEAVTDVMPTITKLYRQRVRWMSGGIEDLRRYGWTPVTKSFWLRQGVIVFGIVSLLFYLGVLALTFAAYGSVHFSLPWLSLTGVFVIDRVVQVWRGGRMARLVAGLMIVELIYDLFQMYIYSVSVYKAMRGKESIWHAT